MKKILFITISVSLIAGCSANTPTPPVSHEMTMADHDMPGMDANAIESGSRLSLENVHNFQTGNVSFSFRIYGEKLQELTPENLDTKHEKKVHLLLVRDDMTQFQHLHPEFDGKKWNVATQVPESGIYYLYFDLAPTNEMPVVLMKRVVIWESTREYHFPEVSVDASVRVGKFTARLTTEPPLSANTATTLTFALTQDGKPVTDIKPYLGAFGHSVILKHSEPSTFVHAHPDEDKKPVDGKVIFHTMFPSSGRYTLFAQFDIDGTVHTFPITVDVPSPQT